MNIGTKVDIVPDKWCCVPYAALEQRGEVVEIDERGLLRVRFPVVDGESRNALAWFRPDEVTQRHGGDS